jgi:hypothetical protein
MASKEREIYGKVPDPPEEVISQAMGNADKFFSNKINGPTSCKEVEYDPENGK